MPNTKKNKARRYLQREAVLPECLVEVIVLLSDYDPRSWSLYGDYLEAMGVDDSAESQIDMMVDILTLGWTKGVSTIGYDNLFNVLRAAETDVADASERLSTLLTSRDLCCNP